VPPPKPSQNHIYLGSYDESRFTRAFTAEFQRSPRFNAAAIPSMLTLVRAIGLDPHIADVRWGAYILATTFWETTSLHQEKRPLLNKKGQPLLDKKGQPMFVTKKQWLMTMQPVDEVGHGKGRRYHEPVKVKLLPGGKARVTEQDGDQFEVAPNGSFRPLTKGARQGTVDGGASSAAYNADDGDEHAYYGRGYVQLTWWSNYAKAGVAVGRGLDLLFNPDLVKDPKVAYEVMSHGMRTGEGFANGRTLSQYFHAGHTDYVKARAMVNGSDHAQDIAEIAKKFEKVLQAARLDTSTQALPALQAPQLLQALP
jgi:hypothetical protein